MVSRAAKSVDKTRLAIEERRYTVSCWLDMTLLIELISTCPKNNSPVGSIADAQLSDC